MGDKKVVIIGAGCAGLSAAYQLQKKGIDFTLYEAAGEIGGRTGAEHFDPERPASYCSKGAVFTEPNNATTFEYLKELGLEGKYHPLDPKIYGMFNKGKVQYLKDDGNLFHAMAGVKGLPASLVPQGMKFLKNVGAATKGLDEGNLEKLLDISGTDIATWTKENGGPEVLDKLIGPMIMAMTIGRPEEISIAHPLALLSFMAGMGQLEGSHAVLNDAMYATFKDKVQLNTPVEEVIIEDGAVKGVKLGNGEIVEADRVIIGTDATDAVKIAPGLPQDVKDALNKCNYSSSFRYVFKFDKRLVPDNYLFVFLPPSAGLKITTIFEENTQDLVAEPGSGVMHVFTAGWHDDYFCPMTEGQREAAVREECAKVFPEFKDQGEVVSCVRYERAINLEAPGQFQAIHAMQERYHDEVKGVWLAGEYGYLIASTEGGYLTGKQAALEVASELGA